MLPKGPLLKRLNFSHCAKLKMGERVWFPVKEPDELVATEITGVKVNGKDVVINYHSGTASGHFTIHPGEPTRCFRFLDEKVLVPSQSKATPRLRVVGEN
jgi:hypothetical protein